MYVPPPFREDRRDVLLSAIDDIRLAALVTSADCGLQAVHLPMIVRRIGDQVLLEGHVALANDFWRATEHGTSALAIFQGPHAYMRPGWLPTKKEHGKVVPSWNYIAVHVAGELSIQKDPAWMRDHVERLSHALEGAQTDPWKIEDAPAGFIDGLLHGIVGLSLKANHIEGAWKLMQHHPTRNRKGVIEGLRGTGMGNELAVAEAMEALEAKLG